MTLPPKKSQRRFQKNKKNNRVKQLSFFAKPKTEHGGVLGVGKRKRIRPLDTTMPLHVILHSDKAKGKLALVWHDKKILMVIHRLARRFQVSIYEKNINFNHIHLLIRGKSRRGLQNFFRSLAGIVARLVTGGKKGKPFGRFWSYLLFSRVLNSWKKDFESVRNYILKNELETRGLIAYKPRRNRAYG